MSAPLRITLGNGRRETQGAVHVVRDAAHVAALIAANVGNDAYWHPAVFQDSRSNENWREGSCIAADVDFHDATGKHVAMPADLKPRLEAAAREVGASFLYLTGRGGRVVFVLVTPCDDVRVWRRAARAVRRRLNRLLIGTGLSVDPVTCTPAQFFWCPNAVVDGVQRRADIQMIGAERTIESLLDGSIDDEGEDDTAADAEVAPDDEKTLALMREITAAVEQSSTGAMLLAGDWERAGFKSSSEGAFVLTKMALRAAGMREELVVDWFMELPVWGDGTIDSPHPEKYGRRDWVGRYVVRAAAADIRANDGPPADQVFPQCDPPRAASESAVRETITLKRAALQPGVLSTPPPSRAFLLRHTTVNGQPALLTQGDGFAPLGLPGFLVSEGGVGKTMLLLALASAAITGRSWLGFEVDRVHAGRRVLLVLAEETTAEVHRRLFEIAEAWNLSEAERRLVESKLFVLALSGCACALASATRDGVSVPTDMLRQLESLLHASGEPWSLVGLDPLARLFPGAESGNVEATFSVQVIERLTTAPGGPLVLVAHHSSKIARRAGDVDARGVTGLADAARLVWSLKPVRDGLVEFAQLKANYAPAMPKAVLLRRGRGGLLRVATDTEIEAERNAKLEAADQQAATEVERVVEAVRTAPNGRVRTKAEIGRLATMKAGLARSAVDRAIDQGLLLPPGKGNDRGYTVAPGTAPPQARSGGRGEEKPPYPRDRGTAGPTASLDPRSTQVDGPGPGRDCGTANKLPRPSHLLPSTDRANAGPQSPAGPRDLTGPRDLAREEQREIDAALRELLGDGGAATA